MLKGVSQNVIEVVEIDNHYFERAILFLRPAVSSKEDRHLLRQKAGEYLTDVQYSPSRGIRKPLRSQLVALLKLAASFLTGVVIASLFFLL